MLEVVAAIIWDKDRFLICQRPATKAQPLLWEFVGGKVEPGEKREDALVRECREELAITISVGDLVTDTVYAYPSFKAHFYFYNATIVEGVPQRLEHNDLRWIRREDISRYAFCPADGHILSIIAGNG